MCSGPFWFLLFNAKNTRTNLGGISGPHSPPLGQDCLLQPSPSTVWGCPPAVQLPLHLPHRDLKHQSSSIPTPAAQDPQARCCRDQLLPVGTGSRGSWRPWRCRRDIAKPSLQSMAAAQRAAGGIPCVFPVPGEMLLPAARREGVSTAAGSSWG